MPVILERDAERKLEGAVQVDDACLGGAWTDSKRWRGAENETPFLAAVQVTEDGQPAAMQLTPVGAFRKDEVKKWAEEHMGPGTRVHRDGPGRNGICAGKAMLRTRRREDRRRVGCWTGRGRHGKASRGDVSPGGLSLEISRG